MKASEAKHFIQKYVFDVEVDGKGDAKSVQDRLSQLFNNRLSELLGEVLDQFDEPEYITRIDKIVLDLGEISEGSLESEIAFRLERQLKSQLDDIIAEIGRKSLSDTERGKRVPLAPAKIDILEYFLEYGRMPTGAEVFKQKVESMLRELIGENTELVVAMLVQVIKRKPEVPIRIVRQFSRQTLETLFRATVPQRLFFLRSQEKEIIQQVTKLTGYSSSRVREETLVAFIKYLYSREKVDFSPQRFRKNISEKLVKTLGARVRQVFDDKETTAVAEGARQLARMVEYRSLIGRKLSDPTLEIPPTRIVEAWEYLVREEPEQLRIVLEQAAKSVTDVVQLIRHLPIEAVRLLVRAVVGQAANKVFEVAVAVIAAHSALRKGGSQEQQLVQEVYASIVFQITREARTNVSQVKIAEQLKQDLKTGTIAARELIEAWEDFQIPGTTEEARQQEARERAAAEAEEKKEIAKRKAAEKAAAEEEKEAKEAKARAKEEAEEEEQVARRKAEEEKEREKTKAKEKEEEEKEAIRRKTEETEEEAEARREEEKAEKEAEEKAERERLQEELREEIARAKAEEEKIAEEEAEKKAEQQARIAEMERRAEELAEQVREEEREKVRQREEAEKARKAQLEDSEAEDLPDASPEIQDTTDADPADLSHPTEAAAEGKVPDARPPDQRELTSEEEAATAAAEEDIADPNAPMRPRYPAKNDAFSETGSLASEEGRIEFILYYFRHGKQPWWANNLRQRDVDALVKRLTADKPRTLAAATRDMIYTTPRTEYPEVIGRIISTLDVMVMMRYFEKIVPEIIGFMGTVARALSVFYDAKEQELTVPPTLNETDAFGWHYPIRYIFEYLSGNPNPAEMLRYVLREVAQEIKMPLREFVEEMGKLADEAIEQGERRFGPFKTMLPGRAQAIKVSAPEMHPGEAEAIEAAEKEAEAKQEARAKAEARAAEEQIRKQAEAEAQAEKEAKEARARKEAAETEDAESRELDSQTEEEGETTEKITREAGEEAEAEKVRKQEKEEEEEKAAEKLAKEKAREEDAPGKKSSSGEEAEEEEQTFSKEKEGSAEEVDLSEKGGPESESKEEDQKAQTPTEDAPDAETPSTRKEEIPEDETPAQKQLRLQKEANAALARVRAAREAEEAARLALDLDEAELEPDLEIEETLPEIIEDVQQTVALVRYYLEHGALPHQVAATFTQDLFGELIQEAFERYEQPMARMLNTVLAKRAARMRMVSLGEEIAEISLLRMNWSLGQYMGTYVQSIVQLIRYGGAPITVKQLLEHAMYYMTEHKSGNFQPVTYLKDLIKYMDRAYKTSGKELVEWMIGKNEEKSVPVKATLAEILEMISAAVARYPGKPDKSKDKSKAKYKQNQLPADAEIFIENAGMVLVWPFLWQFFTRLGLMNEEKEFHDDNARERAAHLMQYMTTKEQNAPEEKLFFNKLLVGLELDYPLHQSIEITEEEMETTEAMLRAVADQWTIMKGAPPEQLRATFMLRNGTLKRNGEHWDLAVDKKGYDMVLKRLPWALSTVRLPWLEFNINVDWG